MGIFNNPPLTIQGLQGMVRILRLDTLILSDVNIMIEGIHKLGCPIVKIMAPS